MTEKQYGGTTGRGADKTSGNKIPFVKNKSFSKMNKKLNKKKEMSKFNDKNLEGNSSRISLGENSGNQKILLAGKIAKEVREWIRPLIKKEDSLLEIAEKIENKIIELGGKPAFPVNLSINEVAAHYTPEYNDQALAKGLLKVDFGVQVDGWCSDQAFSIDLENSEKNKRLIQSAEEALEDAINLVKEGVLAREIGRSIQNKIESYDFSPIVNLSGHKIERYDLHAGLTIPNIDDKRNESLTSGIYAVEPFSTDGLGRVVEGKSSGIYQITNLKNPRSLIAREILKYVVEEYDNLPFCSRWIIKKFGTKALIGLKQLKEFGNLHDFPQLIEAGKGIVAQAEHTILIKGKEKIVITR